ncbi:hypothetical protein BC793_10154 [Actinoplanes xinjiangensis]|uniref:Uncharacterized protein n=2 Tax=Actinoplanes xinjiangensis TaxID=512350 RepID=A0A316FVF1_9ACTN|nr:hypothetical protein BC793_10154 [Actinoplanes xinjiangensis]GIF37253.1 hypothetical protein Axi01nite_15640 [Actinoplanes xinjiangensis]
MNVSGKVRRTLGVMAVVAVIAVALSVMSVLSRPTAGCGCSNYPDLTSAARTADRFAELIRARDSSGVWALLTEDAQTRYGDPVRFRPVLERLAVADGQAVGGWHFVSDRYAAEIPNSVVLTRYTGSQRSFAVIMVHTWRDRPEANRVDPEPAGRTVRVTGGDTGTLRVVGVGPSERAWFVLVNPVGEARELMPGRPGEDGRPLTVPDDARSGPALLAVAVRSATGWSVAAVPLVLDAGGGDAGG